MKMLDTNDNILFPGHSLDVENGFEFLEMEAEIDSINEQEQDEMEAEEKATIEEQESYAIEYDTDLTDDSDDFRDAELHLNAEF